MKVTSAISSVHSLTQAPESYHGVPFSALLIHNKAQFTYDHKHSSIEKP